MKILFATHDEADYLASCLWDGFQEVVGVENVYDAGNNFTLHEAPLVQSNYAPYHNVSSGRGNGKRLNIERNFDLLVLNACFLKNHDWHYAINLSHRLREGGKIAFVEGGDDAKEVIDVPRLPRSVHRFRREISERTASLNATHLTFAAPSRWVQLTRDYPTERVIDVYFAGGAGSNSIRWEMMKYVFGTNKPFTFVFSEQSTKYHFSPQQNFDLLRQSKIALCPAGNGCSCMRDAEVWASGAIPLYLGHQARVRDPYWPGRFVSLSSLPETIDELLDRDLSDEHQKQLDRVSRLHTTAARARKILDVVGLS